MLLTSLRTELNSREDRRAMGFKIDTGWIHDENWPCSYTSSRFKGSDVQT